MKFEINIALETKTQDKFDDILTQVGMLLLEDKTNILEFTLEFKEVEEDKCLNR